ncbi:MAG: energy-coupling factor transporter ATPase [Oscillospiraceae bacterium]|jgi:energy-coupling factor transport system ATP-binding protein|nr:energy-coupling factor transporter ATPase [Oscillospiraceae bacterium]
MAFIEFQDVTYAYAAEEGQIPTPAVKHISLEVNAGQFIALLGANGSGKSTCAKLCNGLLLPDAGKVLVDGMDTAAEENIFDIRRRVGMVFQNPDNQIVAAIVEDDVAFGPENLAIPPKEIHERVEESLRAVGMWALRHAEPYKLSGGQKQRVAIAGALAMRGDCIVFDESTAMLDPRGRREVMETIHTLHREGKTILLITHFMEEALQADRVLVMQEGEITADGTPREVFSRTAYLREAGLELPPAAKLSEALQTVLPAFPVCLTEEECAAAIKLFAGEKLQRAPETPDTGSPPPGAPPLCLSGVTFSYPHTKSHAVNDVSFTLHPGELLAIIGHTGSGKSTLLQTCNGLIKPSAGTVFVAGKNIWENKKSPAEARKTVGICFQYPEYQLFEETVEKDIAFGPHNMGWSEEEIAAAVQSAAALVGLDPALLNESPFELSGGEKRRAALAGILVMRPQVLILDEPVAGLDPRGKTQIMDAIYRYRQTKNSSVPPAVILVSHNMDDVAELADRVLVMENGSCTMIGSPAEVFAQRKRLEAMGLGVPSVTRMFDGVGEVFTVREAVRRVPLRGIMPRRGTSAAKPQEGAAE